MMTKSLGGNVFNLLGWQQNHVIFYVGTASVAYVAAWLFGWAANPIASLPLAVVGGAIGIFVSFRTNSAYDRWWEGRKLWGRLINSSRHFGTQCTTYIPYDDDGTVRRILRRHIAYVHTLRCLLREQNPLVDREVLEYLDEHEVIALGRESNPTHALLQMQHSELVSLADTGKLDAFRLQSFDSTMIDLLNIQGGCERIKKTPIPRGYAFIAEILIRYYSILLPFAMVVDLGLMTLPMNVLVCLSFNLINEAGRVLEDPFTMFYNGLPLFAMSRTIENNLRNLLGEYTDDLHPVPKPVNGILM